MTARGTTKSQHGMQGVFIFVLLGLFALMSTLMVLLGAQMYRATVDKSHQHSQERLLSAYVRSMVRSQDGEGSVTIEEIEGTQVLSLREYDDFGEALITRIYLYDGQIMEYYTREGYEFALGDGDPIVSAHSFEATLMGDLLTVRMTDVNDSPCQVSVALHGIG